MATHAKAAHDLAQQLYRLSFDAGALSGERVAGVLAFVERHRPPNPVMVLKAYRRLVAAELARSHAVVEHAGPISESALGAIAAALGRKYGRAVTAGARPNPALIAGVRVRVGDDIYESTVAGQLASLSL